MVYGFVLLLMLCLHPKICAICVLLGCIFGRSNSSNHRRAYKFNAGALASEARLRVSSIIESQDECGVINRRKLMNVGVTLLGFLSGTALAGAAGLPPEEKPKLCDDACEKELENVW